MAGGVEEPRKKGGGGRVGGRQRPRAGTGYFHLRETDSLLPLWMFGVLAKNASREWCLGDREMERAVAL